MGFFLPHLPSPGHALAAGCVPAQTVAEYRVGWQGKHRKINFLSSPFASLLKGLRDLFIPECLLCASPVLIHAIFLATAES